MGYMTTVTFLNDGWSQIEENPEELIKNIKEGMNGCKRYLGSVERNNTNTYGVGNHCNNMTVVKSHHADDPRMFIAYENSLNVIGWGNDSEHIEYRKRLLKIAKEMVEHEEEEIKRLEEESKV